MRVVIEGTMADVMNVCAMILGRSRREFTPHVASALELGARVRPSQQYLDNKSRGKRRETARRRIGTIVGEGREADLWWVKWDDRGSKEMLYKSWIRLSRSMVLTS